MSWFCLPIEQGGLGILNIEDVQKIAHISAIFRLRKYRDGFVELLNSTPQVPEAMGRFVRDLHSDLRYLKDFLGLGNRNDVTMDDIMTELDKISVSLRKNKEQTFQNVLYHMVHAGQKEKLELLLSRSPVLQLHYKSLVNNTAGKWLQVFPRYSDFSIGNEEYSIGLCFRYMIGVPPINRHDVCPFCAKDGCFIDLTGHHFVSGCMKDVMGSNGKPLKAQRHSNHDFLRTTLYNCCKHAMTRAYEEPAGMFLDAVKKDRPDLSVEFPNAEGRLLRFAVDLTIVCPFEGSGKGVLEPANVPGTFTGEKHDYKAHCAANTKKNKYGAHCKASEIILIPFVMYTTGKLHKTAYDWLKQMSRYAGPRRDIPNNTLFRYWLKVLSVQLVKRIGYTIHHRAMAMLSGNMNLRAAIRNGNAVALEMGRA